MESDKICVINYLYGHGRVPLTRRHSESIMDGQVLQRRPSRGDACREGVARHTMPRHPRRSDTVPSKRPDRDATGRFVKANGVAVTTGLRTGRAHRREVFEVLDDEVRDFLDSSLADDGGRAEIPTRRRSQHEYRAALHRQILLLNAAFEQQGLFDGRGRLRVVWLSKLESLMREARAFDQSLGLARRAKRVPSLDHYLTERYSGADTPSASGD